MRMNKTVRFTFSLLFLLHISFAQSRQQKIDIAVKHLLADSSMKHAILGLYVVNTSTNETVYDINAETGLAPASCQKIFTSIAAMDLLGHDYHFKTELGYDGSINDGELNGNLFFIGYGDPTLGSWRYNETKDSVVLNKWMHEIKSAGIKKINGKLVFDNARFSFNPIPGGWIWDDIGNYYGAGHWALNWHENQYDLVLQPGKNIDDITAVKKSLPLLPPLKNQIRTGKPNSGDNGYIYLPPYAKNGFTEGTIPLQEKEFSISGSMPNPVDEFAENVVGILLESNKILSAQHSFQFIDQASSKDAVVIKPATIFYTQYSPSLDSINYYFLKHSINLYGEALVRTIAYEKNGFGHTDSGVNIVRKYWQERGIEKSALHIMDGSGLSPQNRVTAHSLVTALQYARTRDWFNSFYFDLPEYNQMKLKSGSIGGARSFAGYHTAKDGTQYAVAIIVNNYDGSSSAIVKKMFLILDELK